MQAVDVARALARELAESARRRVEAHGRFSCAVPGGSVAALVFPELARAPLDWSPVDVFLVDERFVPPDHPDSNERLVRELWLDPLGPRRPRLHGMFAADCTLDEAAHRAERDLVATCGEPPRIDVILLGVGPDGHVASLFPHHPALRSDRRWVLAVRDAPKPPAERLSLTLPAVAHAREIWIAAFGREKAAAIAEARSNPQSDLPVALVARSGPPVRWWLDDDAGG